MFEVVEFAAYFWYPEDLAVPKSLLAVIWMCRVKQKVVVSVGGLDEEVHF